MAAPVHPFVSPPGSVKHDKDTDEVIRRFFGFQFKEEVMALSDPINFEGFRKRVDDFYFKKGAFVLFDNGTNVIDRMHRLIVAFEAQKASNTL